MRCGERARLEFARILAQAHRAAEFFDAQQVAQLVDDLVQGLFVALRRVGALEAADVSREVHGRPLEAVADAEERDLPFARHARGAHHAPCAPRAESARHQDAVGVVEQVFAAFLLEGFGLDPVEPDTRRGARIRRGAALR